MDKAGVIRAVELFAGVGGFRLGLARNNIEVVYANDWDKYASDIYDKNFQDTIDRRSISDVPAGDIPAHDIICGGFPCQAFSVAGQRKGFDETRGTLFFEIMRIARHHRTPYLFLENVEGLLNHEGGATFHTMLRSMDELGYDCQWQVLNSKDFGVPQNRKRTFIIGHLRDRPRPQVFPLGADEQEAVAPGGDANQGTAKFIKARHLSQNGSLISDDTTILASEPPHIVRLDDQAKYYQDRVYDTAGIAPTLPASTGGRMQPTIIDAKAVKSTTRRGMAKVGYTGTLDTDALQMLAEEGAPVRRLTPIECERLQGFPDNWTAGVSDRQRYKTMGNAVTVNVIDAIAQRLAQEVAV